MIANMEPSSTGRYRIEEYHDSPWTRQDSQGLAWESIEEDPTVI